MKIILVVIGCILIAPVAWCVYAVLSQTKREREKKKLKFIPGKPKKHFLEFLSSNSWDPAAPDPTRTVGLMAEFYRTVGIRGCDECANADMLLFQYGTYDWGKGEFFEYDITRQVIFPRSHEPNQLSVTIRFEPTEALRGLGSKSVWCKRRKGLSAFLEGIRNDAATQALADLTPVEAEVAYELC